MKKVIFVNGLKAFWAAALLLVLGVVSVQAQASLTTVATVPGVSNPPTSSSGVYAIPQGTFVSTNVAQTRLDDALLALKDQMTTLQQGDPVFNALLVKYRYFGRIQESLKAGANTANAIAVGLWMFLESMEFYYVTPAVQEQLKQEAIALLS
ncbi:MAG: hypothetical protein HY842_06330 [Bacteroidetes bacterium]|nr:hypothetical protein [Bacteroidota bacterium]